MCLRLPPPPDLTGPLTPNDTLTKVEYILNDMIKGPESLVIDGGRLIKVFIETIETSDTIYTGVHDGRLLKIVGGKIVKEIRLVDTQREFGEGIFSSLRSILLGGFEDEIHLGRPLGMRKLEGEKIIVADAYLGVFIVDFENGSNRIFQSVINQYI